MVKQDFEMIVDEIAEDNQIRSRCQWYGKRRNFRSDAESYSK